MAESFQLIHWVVFLPLAAAVVLGLAGASLQKAVGKPFVGLIAVLPLIIAAALAGKITMDLAALGKAVVNGVVRGPDWISTPTLRIPFEFRIDPLSMTMALVITGIGSLIFLYSTGYMKEEKDYARFFAYLNLFVASMLVLVLGNNLGLLFLGWEGVGLCSYLLIGFWYSEPANSRAANKAFIVNRIGDWGLTLGIFLIFVVLLQAGQGSVDGRTLSYDVMLPNLRDALANRPEMATAIALLLFIGAAGKSAQFPLYIWLPDAMAGPTPVSALIHAATMVTSGVVLLNRMHVVFEMSPIASAVVAVIGAFTALFAAVIAFGQTDIKKVLAYSTVSQLGFMFIACGVGAYWAGMFHVVTHAFFKALLFLGAGAVIHAMAHDQDMRNYGRLGKHLPITSATMIIGWLAIASVAVPGVFGLAGYYSKEAILGAALAGDHAVAGGNNLGVIAGWTGLGVALLTSAYMTRLAALTFFGKEERWRNLAEPHAAEDGHNDHGHALGPHHEPREVPISMWLPLVILAGLSIFGGYWLNQDHRLESWLYPNGLAVLKTAHAHPEGIPLEWLSFGAAIGGIVLGLIVYAKGLPKREGDEREWSPLRRKMHDQFGFDSALTSTATDGGGDIARGVWNAVDIGIVDRVVNGFGYVANAVGQGFTRLQSGYIRGYALAMLIGVVGLLGYFLAAGTWGGIR